MHKYNYHFVPLCLYGGTIFVILSFFKPLNMQDSFFKQMETTIRKYWEYPSLSDYKGSTYTYKDVARKIVKLHIMFDNCDIKKGDRIALCSRNLSTWGITFVAIITYGAVAVPVLHEFKSDNIYHIINHSEAKLLFVGDDVWRTLDAEKMPLLDGIFRMEDYSIRISRKEKLTEVRHNLNKVFGEKYPERFLPEHISFAPENPEELAIINYTSGTSGQSKGVMLPFRSLNSNLYFAIEVLTETPRQTMLSMLPMAHMYGLAFEFIYGFCIGSHITFLGRIPSPKIVTEAFAEVRPDVIISVPLIIEKIVNKSVQPKLQSPIVKLLLKIPFVKSKIYKRIHDVLRASFGGKFKEFIIGGAPLNKDVERMLRNIKLEYTVGYGMTEFGPILSYSGWASYRAYSCGRTAPRMELKIDSTDPENIPGEILARGVNTMLGYFKNEKATAEFIDSEGWAHTGDIGLMDSDGNLYIKGRSKNMILTSNGQNIYPEEIEDQINTLSIVAESIVVCRNDHLTALVYPDNDAISRLGISESEKNQVIEQTVKTLNASLPTYCQIAHVEIRTEEFEKTPKKNIVRYIYK